MNLEIIKKIYIKIINIIKDFLSPPFCANCNLLLDKREILCENCLSDIKLIAPIDLEISPNNKIKVYALSGYKLPVKTFILAKFYKNFILSRNLSDLIYDNTNIRNLKFDYIIPIPLHWTRLIRRGYNQAEIMGKRLSELTNKPCVNILKRTKKTKYQLSINSSDRDSNLKDAFEINSKFPEEYIGKNLLIIDDLMTTGSTIKYAAKALKKLKPESILVLVGCRTV